MTIPDNKTDVCCWRCQNQRGGSCLNPQCLCHQSPQTSHDLIGDAVSEFEESWYDKGDERYGLVKHNNTILNHQIEWLRKTLKSIVEKTREEAVTDILRGKMKGGKSIVISEEIDVPTAIVEKLKSDGRAETLQDVHEKILSMPDERTTGIHRLTDAHVLVCWIQEQIKDIKKK